MPNDRFFSPGLISIFQPEKASPRGDRRDGSVYVYTPEIQLAVRVAQATRRPLLIRGGSGNGKSSLAGNVARELRWRYYEAVVTSRTQARDLLWEVDLLRRLSDANLRNREVGEDITPYIKPGVLWWAFDSQSASRRGKPPQGFDPAFAAKDPNLGESSPRAVVLIDEIDKADPDVPNNLLVPLGSLQFQVEDAIATVKADASNVPLVFITTNGERELPAAFVRRCIDVEIPDPDINRLVAIGLAHFPNRREDFLRSLAERIQANVTLRGSTKSQFHIGTAEFLDTIRACDDLGITPEAREWDDLLEMTIFKDRVDKRVKGPLVAS